MKYILKQQGGIERTIDVPEGGSIHMGRITVFEDLPCDFVRVYEKDSTIPIMMFHNVELLMKSKTEPKGWGEF